MRISDWSSDVCSSDLSGFTLLSPLPACHPGQASDSEREPGPMAGAVSRRFRALPRPAAGAPIAGPGYCPTLDTGPRPQARLGGITGWGGDNGEIGRAHV